MKRLGVIALLSLATAVAAVAAGARTAQKPTPSRCGGQLWRLKTLSDPGRSVVLFPTKTTTIPEIAGRPYPRPLPRTRRTAFQRQNWTVVAQITAFKLVDPGLRLILYDDGAYLNAVIPVPSCLPAATRGRSSMTAAWNTFKICGRPTREWQALGAIAYVSGIGFWSHRDVDRGAAPNGAELYPVTGFRIVAGCG